MAMEGAAADVVTAAGAGIVLPSEDAAKMVQAIESIRAMPESEREATGRRASAYLTAHFAKDVVIPDYEAILRRVALSRGAQG
jgi:glycosyltransferase involved in cell wall biosynthesis